MRHGLGDSVAVMRAPKSAVLLSLAVCGVTVTMALVACGGLFVGLLVGLRNDRSHLDPTTGVPPVGNAKTHAVQPAAEEAGKPLGSAEGSASR